LAFGMRLEPALTVAQKLFDLVLSYPIVLVGVEYRDQDIKVREQFLQGHVFGDLYGVVRPLAPLRKPFIKRVVFRDDLIFERFEQTAHKLLSTTTGQYSDSRREGQRYGHEFRPVFAVASQRGV